MNPIERRIARYVDGEAGPAERHDVERRIAADPEFAARVDALRALRGRFAAERARPLPRPDPALRARIVAASLADAATRTDGDGAELVVVWARRAIYAAAALLLGALLARSGLFAPADPGQLQASPAEIQRLMEELDARRDAARRDEAR